MRKIKTVTYMLFAIGIVAFSLGLYKEKVLATGEYEQTVTIPESSGSVAFSAYAYELTVIKYEKKGDTPTQKGNPILIYHPDLFADILNHQMNSGGNLPTSFDDFYTKEYDGLTYTVNRNDTSVTTSADGSEVYVDGEDYTMDDGFHHYEPGLNKNVDVLDGGDGTLINVYKMIGAPMFKGPTKKIIEGGAKPADVKNKKYSIKLYTYSSKAKKGNSYGKDVDTSKYYKLIEDKTLTKSNIENNDYLRTLMSTYGSKDNIENNFGFKLESPEELTTLYIQAVPVQRVLDFDKATVTGSYIHSSFENTYYDGDTGSYKVTGTECNNCNSNNPCDNQCNACTLEAGEGVDVSACTYTIEVPTTVCNTGTCSGTSGTQCRTANGGYGAYCTTYSKKTQNGPKAKTGLYTNIWNTDELSPGYKVRHVISGTLVTVPSHLETSQQSGKQMDRAINGCSTVDSKHCVLADDGKTCTNTFEYYIGPNAENGLVGINDHNPYILVGCPKYNTSKSQTTGVRHLYVSQIVSECKETGYCCRYVACKDVCDPGDAECRKSDAYLQCATNYCESRVNYDEKGNSRNRKRECIINDCGYSYGIIHDNDKFSKDSCESSSIVAEYKAKENIINSQKSTCNTVGDSPLRSKKAAYVTACKGDFVNDYDGKDTDTVFDFRTYINKVCIEETNFEVEDISKLNLFKGSGFEYPVKQEGNKECTYFFNLEQWKFDYASAPARDPDKRKRMMYIIDVYNGLIDDKDVKTSGNYDSRFTKEGQVEYVTEGYDFSKTSISGTAYEKTIEKDEETKLEFEITKTTAIDGTTNPEKNLKTVSALTTIAHDTLEIVTESGIDSKVINRYQSKGEGTVTYELKEACIKTDGKAGINKNVPSNGICQNNTYKIGDKTFTDPVYAERKYYTSLKIIENNKNKVVTNLNVRKKNSQIGNYYEDEETCTYSVSDSDDKCILKIDSLDTKEYGNNKFGGHAIKVAIDYSIPNELVESVTISNNGNAIAAREITVNRAGNRSVSDHKIIGQVKLKSGKVVECKEYVELYENYVNGLSCKINKINDKLYEIVSTGSEGVSNYYNFTTNHNEAFDAELKSSGAEPYSFMERVIESTEQRKVYIKLGDKLQQGEVLVGYITGSNSGRNAYCTYDGLCTLDTCDRPSCEKEYNSANTYEIHNYCESNWDKDIKGYKSADDCFAKCSMTKCPYGCVTKEEMEKFCSDNWRSLGYTEEAICLNTCNSKCSTGDGKNYLFRTVNVYDPFPSSQESETPYEKGNREIGNNWKYLSKYITNDSDDMTSITGANSNNQVEYIIDLSPGMIQKIRKDTENVGQNSVNTPKNTRAVYSTLDRAKSKNKDVIEAFKSRFMRDSEFRGIFQSKHGTTTSTFMP